MALRNKTLAISMILNGWHPIDAYRMMETDVTDVPDYRDRSGHHRPKIIFAGEETHHTKVHSIKVRNAPVVSRQHVEVRKACAARVA